MKLCSAPLPMLLIIFFLNYHCPACYNSMTGGNKTEVQKIKQIVIEAVEYNGWVNEPDYRQDLARIYTGTLLNELLYSVEQFRSRSTDWHSLTFTPKCHIVYNDGNTALVLAFLLETNSEGKVTGQDLAAFKLNNSPGGWRISEQKIIIPMYK